MLLESRRRTGKCLFSEILTKKLILNLTLRIPRSRDLNSLASSIIQAITDGIDLKESRLESLGEDRNGNFFWYFGGIHLYKEDKNNNTWSCIARSTKEWNQVRDSLKVGSFLRV